MIWQAWFHISVCRIYIIEKMKKRWFKMMNQRFFCVLSWNAEIVLAQIYMMADIH